MTQNIRYTIAQGKEYIYDNSNTNIYHHSMTSQSAVIQCTAGSRLWVESRDDKCNVNGDSTYKYSTFGAYLV